MNHNFGNFGLQGGRGVNANYNDNRQAFYSNFQRSQGENNLRQPYNNSSVPDEMARGFRSTNNNKRSNGSIETHDFADDINYRSATRIRGAGTNTGYTHAAKAYSGDLSFSSGYMEAPNFVAYKAKEFTLKIYWFDRSELDFDLPIKTSQQYAENFKSVRVANRKSKTSTYRSDDKVESIIEDLLTLTKRKHFSFLTLSLEAKKRYWTKTKCSSLPNGYPDNIQEFCCLQVQGPTPHWDSHALYLLVEDMDAHPIHADKDADPNHAKVDVEGFDKGGADTLGKINTFDENSSVSLNTTLGSDQQKELGKCSICSLQMDDKDDLIASNCHHSGPCTFHAACLGHYYVDAHFVHISTMTYNSDEEEPSRVSFDNLIRKSCPICDLTFNRIC